MDLFGREIGSEERAGKHEGKAEPEHLPGILEMLMKALCDSFLPCEEIALERQVDARPHVGLDFAQRLFGETDDEPEFTASFLVLADRARKEIEHIAVERHIFARHRYVGIKKLLDIRKNENDRADAVLINAIIY